MNAGPVIRQARTRAGLTQDQLAQRIGTTQSAVARLERAGSNPRIATVNAALRAAGYELEPRLRPAASELDEAQIAERLKLTPAERLRLFESSHANMRNLLRKARRPNARSA
jgi:transcriptional regulator with XRE-family HTH domain